MSTNDINYLKKFRWMIRLLGWFKIPMIGYISPRLETLNDKEASVKIRFRRRTKNHLNSMYFGALAVGADVAAGIHAFYYSEKIGSTVSFAFKGMQADFLKRAESDVIFTCPDGMIIRDAVYESKEKGERVNQNVNVIARDQSGDEVARFTMMISVKVK